MTHAATLLDVKNYYGKILAGKRDLQTKSCCSAEVLPPLHQRLLNTIDAEILERFYGCGSPLPPGLDGATLLDLGCPDYRVMSRRRIQLDNPAIEAKTGMIDFYSITVRAFEIADLEDICEDYGQSAIYRGTIADMPHGFPLDDHHFFETGKPMLVCGNTASMVSETRFAPHFTVAGDRSRHFGPFPCGPAPTAASGGDGPCCPGSGCC